MDVRSIGNRSAKRGRSPHAADNGETGECASVMGKGFGQQAVEMGKTHFPFGFIAASESPQPLGVEIVFVTQSVAEAHATALSCGAAEISAPESKPWGQIVSYVRYPDGTLVELCSPMGG